MIGGRAYWLCRGFSFLFFEPPEIFPLHSCVVWSLPRWDLLARSDVWRARVPPRIWRLFRVSRHPLSRTGILANQNIEFTSAIVPTVEL